MLFSKNNLLYLLFFIVSFAQAQKPSFVFFNVKNNVKMQNGASVTERRQIKCLIKRSEKFADIVYSDTLVCKVKNEKNVEKYKNESRQKIEIKTQLIDDQLDGIFSNIVNGFSYIPKNKTTEVLNIPFYSYKKNFLLDFKNGAKQNFIAQKDSMTYSQELTLQIPTCINEKPIGENQGLITIYFRAAREHLNKQQPSASSGSKIIDWGHAFIGVKDLKSGKSYFLDGWPDEKYEDGEQHFEWNKKVDAVRTSDHHSITFNTNSKKLATAKKMIENYQTACVDYKVLDFNCTDATCIILEKLGYYTLKENSGTVFPNTFADELMEKLDKLGICYEFDGRKVK
jgi:hypothetical protein